MTEFNKIPPQAIEIEEAVLGALMIEANTFERVQGILRPESFYKAENRAIYEIIAHLASQNKPIDLLVVVQELQSRNKLEEIGGPAYIADLTTRVGSAAHLEYHAKVVVQKAMLRDLIRISSELQAKAFDESNDVDELITDASKAIDEITSSVGGHSGRTQYEVIKSALSEIEQDCIQAQKGQAPGITTGFTTVDKYTGGWRPTNLIILAARPGVGKTSLALHFAKVAASQGKWVNFYGLEMTSEDLTRIMIAGESGVNRSSLRDGKVNSEWNSIHKATGNLYDLPILWYDQAGITADQIAANTRKNAKRGQCDMVIVDYLQLLTPTDKKAIREQQVSLMTRTLKKAGLESKVPIILLSQLNREASESQPKLHHLRESGAIEQDADIVVFPWIDLENNYQLIIAKNRRGITGMIEIKPQHDMTRFSEGGFSSRWPEYNPDEFVESLK